MERTESLADERHEVKRYYRSRWEAMLQLLLDWPEDAAREYAGRLIDRVGDNPFLEHETAADYLESVILVAVPTEVRRLGSLRSAMELAIHEGEPDGNDTAALAQWLRAAKPRLQRVLRQHGGELPHYTKECP